MTDVAEAHVFRPSSPSHLRLGAWTFDLTDRAIVMGIVNRTPDSFFDKGRYFSLDQSVARAAEMVSAGADIIDVGGVKAGPGPAVSIAEELERVIPAITAIAARLDVAISVDSWRTEVVTVAFEAGASLGNDISGFSDPGYLEAAARFNAGVVATHIRLGPRIPDPNPTYPGGDVVYAVSRFLADRREQAILAGVSRDSIVLDAGLDLGKSASQSLALLRSSDRLAELGQPLLLSASNKTFLGVELGLDIDKRRDASLSAAALGISRGCRIVRTHDVAGTRRVADVLAAVVRP